MLTVILTGGRSRRMGRDKATVPWEGGPACMTLAARYACLGPVAFSVAEKGRFPCGDYPELPDAFPDAGPLNGLYSAFTQTEEETVFLTATDLLMGDPELAQELLRRCGEHQGCAIRRTGGKMEPLFAIYKRSCLPAVEEALNSGRKAMMRVYDSCNILAVDEKELDRWDLDRTLFNMNTPEDWILLNGAKKTEGSSDGKAQQME